MKKLDCKTIYAQSSDIRSRTYIEYRKDMKKKAIAELEVLDWLRGKLEHPVKTKNVNVYKSGGDKFIWFLRKGGVSREPDFIAEVGSRKIEFEFQYTERTDLEFYDFKISKVMKRIQGKEEPISNKLFIYIHKPLRKYAIFPPKWIAQNAERGMVEAWRSYAFRVPRNKFMRLLRDDPSLKVVCDRIDAKNFILNFQHELIDINKEKLSYLLQGVIDENQIVRLIPKDLDSFFKVCFIMDNLNKIPRNANLWLVYLLTYINDNIILEDISKIVYCMDFLYSKIELQPNEICQLVSKVKALLTKIKTFYTKDGAYISSIKASPLEETRYALFSINLLEDLVQDLIFYYSVEELTPIKKIYENIENLKKTYAMLKRETNK